MRTHPKIDPVLRDALKRVRTLFREDPASFNGDQPYVYSRSRCGCIVAHLKKITGKAGEYSDDVFARFPSSRRALVAMWDQSASDYSKRGKQKTAEWAIKRIDKALATNT